MLRVGALVSSVSISAYSACECFGSERWCLVCLLVLTLLVSALGRGVGV